jgi:hypothetical protein
MTTKTRDLSRSPLARLILSVTIFQAALAGGCIDVFLDDDSIEYPEARTPEVQAVVEIAKANEWDSDARIRYAHVDTRLAGIYALETNVPKPDGDWWLSGGMNKFAAACLILEKSQRPDREAIARRLLEEGRARGDGLCILALGGWDAIGPQAALDPTTVPKDAIRDPAILATAVEAAVLATAPAFPSNIVDFYPAIAEQGLTSAERAWSTLSLIGSGGSMPGLPYDAVEYSNYRSLAKPRPGKDGHATDRHFDDSLFAGARRSVAVWLRDRCVTGWLTIPAAPQLAVAPAGVLPIEREGFAKLGREGLETWDRSYGWFNAHYEYQGTRVATWDWHAHGWTLRIREEAQSARELAQFKRKLDREYAAEKRQRDYDRALRDAADAEEQRQQWSDFSRQYGQGGGIQGELNRQNSRLIGGAGSSPSTPTPTRTSSPTRSASTTPSPPPPPATAQTPSRFEPPVRENPRPSEPEARWHVGSATVNCTGTQWNAPAGTGSAQMWLSITNGSGGFATKGTHLQMRLGANQKHQIKVVVEGTTQPGLSLGVGGQTFWVEPGQTLIENLAPVYVEAGKEIDCLSVRVTIHYAETVKR